MKIYSAMPAGEFISWLRDAAIRQGADEQIIHKIDELNTLEGSEEELERLRCEVEDLKLLLPSGRE